MLPMRPAAAQRVTVLGSTRNNAATSPGVSRRSPVSTAPPRLGVGVAEVTVRVGALDWDVEQLEHRVWTMSLKCGKRPNREVDHYACSAHPLRCVPDNGAERPAQRD